MVPLPDTKTATMEDEAQSLEHEEQRNYKAAVWAKYKKQMPINHDKPGGAPDNESVWALPDVVKKAVLPLLQDKRDYIAFELLVNVCVGILPFVALLWYFPSHWAGALFLSYRFIVYAQRFILSLHLLSHTKPLFHESMPGAGLLNALPENFFSVLFGIPPGFYHIHHVMMHHLENNTFPGDISATNVYQRDSLLSLVQYIFKHFSQAILYVPYYAFRKRNYPKLAKNALCGVMYFLVIGIYGLRVAPVFTLWMFHIPFFLMGVLLMHGNMCQHLLLDPENPTDKWTFTFNAMNQPDNQRNYNDGYHIVHHINSRLHWTEQAQWFEDNIDMFAKKGTLNFQGVSVPGVYLLILQENYEQLYKHWVQLQPGPNKSVAEFTKLIKRRLEPTPVTKKQL